MFLTSRTGLGKDTELISLRRRFRYGILLLFCGGIAALIIAFSLLRDRSGVLLVKANNSTGFVVLNGEVTSTPVGTPIKKLRPDTYQVAVYLDGFITEPASRLVQVKSGKTAEVEFILIPESQESTQDSVKQETSTRKFTSAQHKIPQHTDQTSSDKYEDRRSNKPENKNVTPKFGTLKVTTIPVAGGIWLDDNFKGRGKLTVTDLPLGEFIIRFGEVDGYRTPEPQKAFLTTSWPYANVEAVYLPLIYISSNLNQNGHVVSMKCEVIPGFIMGETEGTNDPAAGPVIKYIEERGFFAWEIGYAYSNRNPPGEDFIDVVFTLPENFAGNKPLELQLYGYSSQRRYPFALSGKTEIDIVVNSHIVKQFYVPATKLENASSGSPDVFQVNNFLQVGENRIRIKSSSSSRCFYYLRQIVLL